MDVKLLRFPGLLLLMSFLAGCASGPLVPVPRSLAESSSLMKVERSRRPLTPKPLSFGEWQVSDFEQKGFPHRRRWGYGIGRLSYRNTNTAATYRFVMTSTAQERWECRCEHTRNQSDFRERRVGALALSYDELLQCDLQRAGDAAVWKLRVDGSLARRGEDYKGALTQGERSISLDASHMIEDMQLPGPPTGYFFVRDGEDIASTELVAPGIVRISDEASDDRDLIATAAAALLLQPAVF